MIPLRLAVVPKKANQHVAADTLSEAGIARHPSGNGPRPSGEGSSSRPREAAADPSPPPRSMYGVWAVVRGLGVT
jgi:hypothetical protein